MDTARSSLPATGPSTPGPPANGGVEVEVRVLGPVEVVGAARPFRRAWTLDLVVFLALHPRGVTSEAWATALWPDRLVADPTRHSTVSSARRALGRSAGGADHLPHRHGSLRLAATVGTDWDRFARLAAVDEPASWSEALALVRGRPFEGLRSIDWTVLEGVAAEVEDAVVQLALRLAEHRLVAGDGRGAELAARRGLLVSPYDERLYRLLFRAADSQGNPNGVESAMAELVQLVGGDPWAAGRSTTGAGTRTGGGARARGARGRPGDGSRRLDPAALVHPQTASLYRTLSRRRPAGAGIGGQLLPAPLGPAR